MEAQKDRAEVARAWWIARATGRAFTWMHNFYIAQTAIYFVYFATSFVWAALTDYGRNVGLFDFIQSKPFLIWTAAFFFTALSVSLTVLLVYVRHRQAEFKHYTKMAVEAQKNKVIEPLFLEIAYANAACDMRLFDSLFLQLHELIPAKSDAEVLARLDSAHHAVADNIGTISDVGRDIFNALTGYGCAVSVKLLRPNEITPAQSLVATFLRDTKSAASRGVVDETHYKVDDNSAFAAICLQNEPHFVNDDLVGDAKDGKYINRRKGWERDYSATIVVPIFEITKPDFNQKPQHLLGFFCVDNRGGGFEQPDSIRCATELAWRLSVMLYRYRAIQSRVEAKRATTAAGLERNYKRNDKKGPDPRSER
jgi:hypothetical protein